MREPFMSGSSFSCQESTSHVWKMLLQINKASFMSSEPFYRHENVYPSEGIFVSIAKHRSRPGNRASTAEILRRETAFPMRCYAVCGVFSVSSNQQRVQKRCFLLSCLV